MILPIPYTDDNYAYVASTPKGCILFDCGTSSTIIKFLSQQSITPDVLMITHGHHDHAGGASHIRAAFPRIETISPDTELEHANLTASKYGASIIETPGHTLDHRCFYMAEENALFTGDALFAGGCGRCFSGEFELFADSLKRLGELPDSTRIYPGHEYLESNYQFLKAIGKNSSVYEQRLANESFPSVGLLLSDELLWNPFLNAAAKGDGGGFTRLRREKDLF